MRRCKEEEQDGACMTMMMHMFSQLTTGERWQPRLRGDAGAQRRKRAWFGAPNLGFSPRLYTISQRNAGPWWAGSVSAAPPPLCGALSLSPDGAGLVPKCQRPDKARTTSQRVPCPTNPTTSSLVVSSGLICNGGGRAAPPLPLSRTNTYNVVGANPPLVYSRGLNADTRRLEECKGVYALL